MPRHPSEPYEKYKAFVDHASDAMFLHSESGHVLDVNRRACETLLYSEQELIGMHPRDFDPLVSDAELDSMLEKMNAGESLVLESIHRRRDGFEFPVEIRLRPFLSQGRRLALAMVSDISQRRMHETLLNASGSCWSRPSSWPVWAAGTGTC